MSNIQQTLIQAFKQHRIIFWYDELEENKEALNEVALEGIEIITADKNEFFIKYHVLREKPNTKFLLYFPYAKPSNDENWLLDIELSNFLFTTDQESIFLQELGWDFQYKEFIKEHIEFFKAKDRRKKISAQFVENDSFKTLKYKLVAAILGIDNFDLPTIIQYYANAYFTNLEKLNNDLRKYNLLDFLWTEIKDKYNYNKDNQSIFEFIIDVFDKNFVLTEKSELHPDSRLILAKWRDSLTMSDSYIKMAKEIEEILSVKSLLEKATVDEVLQGELFELTEQKIIFELVNEIIDNTISSDRFYNIIKNRENKFWFKYYKDVYRALENAFELIQTVANLNVEYNSVEEGINFYAKLGYMIDFKYRKFYYHYRNSNNAGVINHLIEKVENVYINDWLFKYANKFQKELNTVTQWNFENLLMQNQFFAQRVDPILQKQKVFVIISDALRYECGKELALEIVKENRFIAKLEPMVAAIPSYTQLGMASLLPHNQLAFKEDSDAIVVDGISSQGTENRTKILLQNTGKRAKAMLAEDFKALNKTERTAEIKNHDIIYLYHNQIDKAGDDKMTESKVFEAVNSEIDYLVKLVKDLTSANATKILITADHGFLFQSSKVNENDFEKGTFSGDTTKVNRRFVLGKNLLTDEEAMKFKATDLNIQSDAEVIISKGINRFRVKGAGSQFVHGGASLQEIIVPCLEITKTRENDTRQVEIDTIQSISKVTTNLLPVEFIQNEPVSDKVLPIQIKAYLKASDDQIISDTLTYHFDSSDEELRNRSKKHTFQLASDAGTKYRKQMIELILETPIPNTTRWKEYKKYAYLLDMSFTNDWE